MITELSFVSFYNLPTPNKVAYIHHLDGEFQTVSCTELEQLPMQAHLHPDVFNYLIIPQAYAFLTNPPAAPQQRLWGFRPRCGSAALPSTQFYQQLLARKPFRSAANMFGLHRFFHPAKPGPFVLGAARQSQGCISRTTGSGEGHLRLSHCQTLRRGAHSHRRLDPRGNQGSNKHGAAGDWRNLSIAKSVEQCLSSRTE